MSSVHSREHTEFLRKEATERQAVRDNRSDVDQLAEIAKRGAKVPAINMKEVKATDLSTLSSKGYCKESIRLVKRIMSSNKDGAQFIKETIESSKVVDVPTPLMVGEVEEKPKKAPKKAKK